jgi:hypothetical protein
MNQTEQPPSRRWLLALYLLLALPTLFVVAVVKPTGDTNALMWFSGIAAIVLGLPWTLLTLSSGNPTSAFVFCIAVNVVLLWVLTRRRPNQTFGRPTPLGRRPYGIYDANNRLLPPQDVAHAIHTFDREACNRLLQSFGKLPSSESESLQLLQLRCISTLEQAGKSGA